MTIKILGISAFYHDSAAALIVDGKVKSAIQEERFTRKKHDESFPENSIRYILKSNNTTISDIDHIVFYEKPLLKFERLLETYLDNSPFGIQSFSKSMPVWSQEKIFQKQNIFSYLKKIDREFNDIKKIQFVEHHISHAASAFYPSPFEDAIILTADGVGEWATTTVAIGNKNNLEMQKEINYPHSLGLIYSAFTYYCGFKVNDGEYKLMGLAPYGDPKYFNLILDKLMDIKEDGSFRMNQYYFDYSTGLRMINKKFEKLFGMKSRDMNSTQIDQFYMDIAASIQKVLEFSLLKICHSIRDEYNLKNLCMAGGVALNCVANGKILEKKIFDNIWIQPAAGDAGGAIGSALYVWHNLVNQKNDYKEKNQQVLVDDMNGSYLGPEFTKEEIKKSLDAMGAKYKFLEEETLIDTVSKKLSESKAIGWFQGKMEFGPRALGNRSILADPRSENMQKNLNLKIKYRESFRPFAPAILSEEVNNWFELETDSPYMLLVSKIKENKKIKLENNQENLKGIKKLDIKRSLIPAITHVDYSARVQTVNKNDNPIFYKLIKKFQNITGVPILVNTSFNVRDEPIVNSIEDAYKCFLKTDLDYLVCGNFFLEKSAQYEKIQ
jgi:carbamoyltransferase|tara:strand:+ start:638 stop:2467 length:1830 start_codon:yes stop_codon:yes gene_type:complete